MKIALLGLHHDANQGDPLICLCVKKLMENEIREIEWVDFDLNHKRYFSFSDKIYIKVIEYLFKINEKVNSFWSIDLLSKINFYLLTTAYKSVLKDIDFGMIAGGGIIHYKHHDYATGICAFINACIKSSKDVFINAVGIEGFEEKSKRCKLFKHFLSSDNVKIITTRDDIETLQTYYLHGSKNKYLGKVADPAIFCSDLLKINKNTKSSKIGIGLIRGSIFSDFKSDFDETRLATYYYEIVRLCVETDMEFEFFTNGYYKDLEILKLVEEKCNFNLPYKVPQNAKELVKIISSYQGIITARMHSCIIAYSLNIPAVAFNWCEKLKFWGETIGKPDCFIPMSELNGSKAFYLLLKELKEQPPYDLNIKEQLRKNYLESIKYYIQTLNSK